MSGNEKQLRMPAELVPSPHGPNAGGPCEATSGGDCSGRTVYAWDSGRHYPQHGTSAEDAVLAFIAAHGIVPKTMMIGNEVSVRVRCDGSLWLHVWRAVSEDFPLCPHCPACVKQEPVAVPLVACVPPPMMVGACNVDDRARGVMFEAAV